MPDRVKEIWTKLVDWWKRFTRKQQIIIVSVVAVVILAVVILAYVLTRPEMYVLRTCDSLKEAASVQELLNGENIYNEVSADGLTFTIKKKDQARASILLGSNEISTNEPNLDDVLSGGLSTTEADKNKLYQDFKEKYYSQTLESLENVESATVLLDLPTDDGTLIAEQQEASASIYLTLNGEMDEEQAAGIAKMIATQLGNETTDNISILDTATMSLLFSGGTDSAAGAMSSQLSTKQKLESQVKGEVKSVVLGTGEYNDVEVGLNLALNFGSEKVVDHQYYLNDGQDQGYLYRDSTYESETVSGNGGVPGTDSNGENGTTYVIDDGNGSTQTITDYTRDYDVNEKITEREAAKGDINYEGSSISVSLKKLVKYDEDTLRASGALDELSFDEYRAQIESQDKQKLTVDEEYFTMVSNATGITTDKITIVAYEEPVFVASTRRGRTLTDYLEILLAILIFALLGFVVFMSTRKEKQEEMEPELSVETLLETTKDAEDENLEDIGFKEKSEARLLIEKFVDEKPEAVASLLRNWLNEDWE